MQTDDGEYLWTATSGQGPPLVLCHGGPGLWDDQEPVAAMIDDLATVHRYDQRGCGRSSGPDPYTVARFVVDLEVIREHFGYESWMVGGHSWGATLALRYALAYPERVTALLYVSGTGVGRDWKGEYQAERERRLTAQQHQRLNELKTRNRSRAEEQEYMALSWAPDYADRSRALELATTEAQSARFEINVRCNTALNTEIDTTDEDELLTGCRSLEIPVFVVTGEEDPRPVCALESMVAALPRVELHTLPGVGHMPWVERPEALRSV